MILMRAGNTFFRFVLYSVAVHILLLGYIVFDPSMSFFPKKHISIKGAMQVSSIDLSELKAQTAPPAAPKVLQKKTAPKKKPAKKVKLPEKQKKPDKKKAELKKDPAVESAKQQELKKDPAVESAKQQERMEREQKQAIEKVEALSAVEQIKKEVEGPGQAGGNAQGMEVDFETLKYFTSVKAHINMYWSLPPELADRRLRAEVYTIINEDGRVLKGRIIRSSGNVDFDGRVLEAVEKASPLPRPPTKKIAKMLSKGVVFKFPE